MMDFPERDMKPEHDECAKVGFTAKKWFRCDVVGSPWTELVNVKCHRCGSIWTNHKRKKSSLSEESIYRQVLC